MPSNIQLGSFVLGGILLVLGLAGGNIKIFGAEILKEVSTPIRIIAAILGIALIGNGILDPIARFPRNTSSPTPAATRIEPIAAVIETIAPAMMPSPTQESIYQCRVTTATGAVNLRNGPGANFSSLGLLRPDDMFKVDGWTESKDGSQIPWFSVTTSDKRQGWIISRPYPDRGLDYECNFSVLSSFPFTHMDFTR